LLPALEKSPEELANLGKIIIASLKAMMASGLGDALEGDYRDVVLRKPTNSPAPYLCIMMNMVIMQLKVLL
jgi:intracellular multiplication protein IcmO